MLKLILDARTGEYFQRAVEFFVRVAVQSPRCLKELQRVHGYQLLAGGLARHCAFINNAVVASLLFLIRAGSPSGEGSEDLFIANGLAFKDIIFDFEIWRRVPPSIAVLIFEYIHALLTRSAHKIANRKFLYALKIVPKFLAVLIEPSTSTLTCDHIILILTTLLAESDSSLLAIDARHLEAILLVTLDPFSTEKEKNLSPEEDGTLTGHLHQSRDRILRMLAGLLADPVFLKKHAEVFTRVLRCEVFMFMLEVRVADTSALLALRIIARLLSEPSGIVCQKFRAAGGFQILGDLLPIVAHIDEVRSYGIDVMWQ